MTREDPSRLPEVLVEEAFDLPLVRLVVMLHTGGGEDPVGLEGLANFSSELAKRGAAGRSREALDEAFDALGCELFVSTGYDAVSFEVDVLARNAEPALALMADVLLRPDLDDDEADQLRRETEANLDEMLEDDPSVARRFFARSVFGETHPYGRPTIGTRASLKRLDAGRARRWLERSLSSGGMVVGAAGAIDPAHVRSLAARHFGVLRGGAPSRATLDPPPPPRAPRVTLVDKPERTQSQILLGQVGIPWGHPDWFALTVGIGAFGGTFTARLMHEVRSKRGLSYGASCRLPQGRGARALQTYVFPAIEKTGETLDLVRGMWRDWAANGLRDDEVEFTREHLAGSFVFDTITPDDRLDLRLSALLCGLPSDFIMLTPERLRGVTPADVRRAMQAHVRPEAIDITLLATRDRVDEQLRKLGVQPTVVPFDSW